MRLALLLIVILTGCGAGVPSQKAKSTLTTTGGFSVERFEPPSGTVSAVPTTVVVTFNSSDADPSSVRLLTSFNMLCDGVTYAANAVSFDENTVMATITFSAFSLVPSGVTCQFMVSSSLKNSAGKHLSGNRQASYFYSI